jgi:hypothetical protein
MQDILRQQSRVEELAEQVLTLKQTLIDFDRRRADLNIAIRSLNGTQHHKKLSIFCHGIFIKLDAKPVLIDEMATIETNIEQTRKELKAKVCDLNAMTGGKNIDGLELNSLNSIELQALNIS